MNPKQKQKLKDPTIWLRIDIESVKRRINQITEQVEAVRRKFENGDT